MLSPINIILLTLCSISLADESVEEPNIVQGGNEVEVIADGELLLLEWIPIPINKYRYLVLNNSDGNIIEEGETTLDKITKKLYPNVRAALSCVIGDGEFIYLDDIPLITVDAFKDDHYFQEYQNIIFTIHGFDDKIHLWAHFLKYKDAFQPVRDRLSAAYQNFLENVDQNTSDQPPKVIAEEVEDFGGQVTD